MGIVDKLSNVRYTAACDRFVQQGSKLGLGKLGVYSVPAVLARATAHADELPLAGETPASPPIVPSMAVSALKAAAGGMQTLIGWEQALTAHLHVPGVGVPALTLLSPSFGLPHAHNHPPNLTPPNPVPMPLPSMGPVIPIPILSGAMQTQIAGFRAIRCGDMGVAAFCGGYFPFYEIFLGSATVWIEGARAARMTVDITKHCSFSAPKPSDPPMGPMVGTTIGLQYKTLIGGIPMPSLFSLAIAGLFKGVAKGGKALFNRLTAKAHVERLLGKTIVLVDEGAGRVAGKWSDDVVKDLEKIAGTRTGRQLLNRLVKTEKKVYLRPYLGADFNAKAQGYLEGAAMDLAKNKAGAGSDSLVEHTPSIWSNHPLGRAGAPKQTTSDAILFHELNHATNDATGMNRAYGTNTAGGWDTRWHNWEEYSTVAAENGYRRETGLPERASYTAPFP